MTHPEVDVGEFVSGFMLRYFREFDGKQKEKPGEQNWPYVLPAFSGDLYTKTAAQIEAEVAGARKAAELGQFPDPTLNFVRACSGS